MATAWLSAVFASTALAAGPDAARLQQAIALESTDEPAALAALDALVKQSPAWELPRMEDARLRLKRGEGLELAEAHLDAARSLAPENPRAHFLWGSLLEEKGQRAAAIAAYQVALALRPGYEEARFRLAGLQFSSGDYAAAADAYRELCKAHPNSVPNHLQLAAAAEKAGLGKEAEAELKRLFEAPASRMLGGRRLAEFYERTGRLLLAVKVRTAIEPPPRKLRELKRSGR